jgi:hypothetical protein
MFEEDFGVEVDAIKRAFERPPPPPTTKGWGWL